MLSRIICQMLYKLLHFNELVYVDTRSVFVGKKEALSVYEVKSRKKLLEGRISLWDGCYNFAFAEFFIDKKKCFISSIYVANSWRHKGVGTEILFCLEDFLRRNRLGQGAVVEIEGRISPFDLRSQKYLYEFYEKNGYHIDKRVWGNQCGVFSKILDA